MSPQLPSPSLLSAESDKTRSATNVHSTQSLQKLLQKRVVALRAKVAHICESHDRDTSLTISIALATLLFFTPGSFVLVNRPALSSVLNASAEVVVKHTYKTLQAQPRRLNGILIVQVNTERIENNGNPQDVSINYVAHAASLLSRQLDQSQKVPSTRAYRHLKAKNAKKTT